jgi:hypothetical protein
MHCCKVLVKGFTVVKRQAEFFERIIRVEKFVILSLSTRHDHGGELQCMLNSAGSRLVPYGLKPKSNQK